MAVENRKSLVTGIALGVAGMLVYRNILPVLEPLARPVAKEGIKLALLGFERGREGVAHLSETLSDVVAEVQVELQDEHDETAAVEIPITVATTTHRDGDSVRPLDTGSTTSEG